MVCNSRHTNESNHTGSEVKLEGSQRYVHPVEGSQGALERWLVLRAAQGHQPRSQPPPLPGIREADWQQKRVKAGSCLKAGPVS